MPSNTSCSPISPRGRGGRAADLSLPAVRERSRSLCLRHHDAVSATPGAPKPKGAPIHWLGADQDYTAAPELGALVAVYNQDLSNLPRVQRGLKAMTKPGVTLANYQEIRIRQFHRDLDAQLDS